MGPLSDWIDFCKSRAQNEGFEVVVEEFGDGPITSDGQGANPYCASSLSVYGVSSQADPCVPGLRLEVETLPNVWQEVAFIPKNLGFCGGEIQVSAEQYPELFIHPFRFVD